MPSEPPAPGASLAVAVAHLRDDHRVAAWHAVRQAGGAAALPGPDRLLAAELYWLLGDDRAALRESQAAFDLGVPDAVLLLARQAHNAGWLHRESAMLSHLLAQATAGDHSPGDGAQAAHALERLVRLHVDHHDHAVAAAALDRYLDQVPASPSLLMQAARVYRRHGAAARARAAIERALVTLPRTADAYRDTAATLLEMDEFDQAAELYGAMLGDPAAEPGAREMLARLCLWRGDLEGALAEASALPSDGTVARRVRAAVLVLRGDPGAALPLLDAVLRDDPRDGEAYLWRADAHLRLHHRDDACRDADRSLQYGYSYAASAVRMLAVLPRPTRARRFGDALRRAYHRLRPPAATAVAGGLRQAREELRAEITAICEDGEATLADSSVLRLVDALESSLRAMRGNRTRPGTFVRADGTLAGVPPTSSPRILARQALELVRVAPVAEALRAFDALVARFPESSMPLAHRGELHLWLGDQAAARTDLEASIAIRRQTRWAWYGLAWLDILAGDPQRALDTCAEGIAIMHNTEGAVALIVRGEAYRLLGRLDEARRELTRSNDVFPSRLSAWVNLALVHESAGDGNAQRAVMRHIARMAPTLVSLAAAELDEAIFECVVLERPWLRDGEPIAALDAVLRHMLTMMRGNRASGLITYFTREGELRHVPRGGQDDRLLAPPPAATWAHLRGALGLPHPPRG